MSFWENRNVLVTGCTGFLGSWLVMVLHELGATAIGLVRDQVPQCNFYLSGMDKQIKIVRGSITDLPLIERIIYEYDINTVFQVAAQAVVGIANSSPLSTIQTNTIGTSTILEAVRTTEKVERLIIASTDKVYGNQEIPYLEDSPLLGNFPYDVSKVSAELIAQMYYETYFKVKNPQVFLGITRCANLFGGGDFNWSRLVPGQIRNIIQDKDIWFNSCKRQFLYILDAVRAYILLAESVHLPNIDGEAFNFGMGGAVSIKDISQKYMLSLNQNSKSKAVQIYYPNNEECPPNEIRDQYMDVKKAEQQLGWKAIYSFEEGLKETYDWYCSWFNNEDMKKVSEKLLKRKG